MRQRQAAFPKAVLLAAFSLAWHFVFLPSFVFLYFSLSLLFSLFAFLLFTFLLSPFLLSTFLLFTFLLFSFFFFFLFSFSFSFFLLFFFSTFVIKTTGNCVVFVPDTVRSGRRLTCL